MFRRLHLAPLLLLVASTALSDGPAQAGDQIICRCLFAQDSGYSAVGTRAVCSTMTHKNPTGKGEHCEIAFGSAVNEAPQLAKLKLDPEKYQAAAFALTQQNLAAVQRRNPELIANGAYLREAIPAYMRAVYLRAQTGIEEGELNQLDTAVRGVSSEYADQIADVFLGHRRPFDTVWHDQSHLFVEVGAVRIVYAGRIDLVAVFFDSSDRR